MAMFGAAAMAILWLIAWGYARTTVYTLTDKRLVIRNGIALPVTMNLPFGRVDGVSLRLFSDNSGDIPLILNKADRVPMVLLWPHLKPWRFTRPEPMLRSVPDAVHVASLLTAALKGQPVRPMVASAETPTAPGLQPA
jgi:Bacterial PH domain